MALPILHITEKGQLALQTGGLAGWTLPVVELASVLPAPPDYQAVIGDFTLMSYTGYGHDTLTLTGGYVDPGTSMAYALSNLLVFEGPTSGAGGNALGFVIQNSSTHDVWAWGSFSVAKQENVPTDVVAFELVLAEDLSWQVIEITPPGLA
jgi:hypothetical protein